MSSTGDARTRSLTACSGAPQRAAPRRSALRMNGSRRRQKKKPVQAHNNPGAPSSTKKTMDSVLPAPLVLHRLPRVGSRSPYAHAASAASLRRAVVPPSLLLHLLFLPSPSPGSSLSSRGCAETPAPAHRHTRAENTGPQPFPPPPPPPTRRRGAGARASPAIGPRRGGIARPDLALV